MKNRWNHMCLACVLAMLALAAVSCEKNSSDAPKRFEPGIDGVAVAPLPPIDESMAQVSLNDLDAVPSHRDTSTSLDAGSMPTISPSEEVAEPETAMEETEDYSYETMDDSTDDTYDDSSDSYDANSV